ncbi:MAG: DUF4416 family protein [Betaproteobacteria bacterium]
MGEIHPPLPVKLFIGMLSSEPALFDTCSEILQGDYGPLEDESGLLPWDNTDYYREEMGTGILRKFLFFKRIIDPGKLSSIKILTNILEKNYAVRDGQSYRRRVNLDPGYVTEAKVVLATTKDFAHRIYIGEGIYAEATLRYSTKERKFAPFEHTYPDYRTEAYLALFNSARENLRAALHKKDLA